MAYLHEELYLLGIYTERPCASLAIEAKSLNGNLLVRDMASRANFIY